MASPPECPKLAAWCKWCRQGGRNKGIATRLLAGHTPEWWLPTAFGTSTIFKGQSQTFLLYKLGCFIHSDRIVQKNDALF